MQLHPANFHEMDKSDDTLEDRDLEERSELGESTRWSSPRRASLEDARGDARAEPRRGSRDARDVEMGVGGRGDRGRYAAQIGPVDEEDEARK